MIWRCKLNNNIKLVRLVSGEDIIADTGVNGDIYNLKNPIVVVAMPGNPGQQPNVGFAPWMPFSKDREFTIASSQVVCYTEPLPEFITQYQAINSKLDLPTPSKLIIPGR